MLPPTPRRSLTSDAVPVRPMLGPGRASSTVVRTGWVAWRRDGRREGGQSGRGSMNILAIDQGTSATKALVVGDGGAILSVAECPVHPSASGDGAVEQDPAELLASVMAAGRAAVAQAGVVVHGIGLANQGETVLAWDRPSGRPLTTALSWQDRRAISVTDDLGPHQDRLGTISGLPLDPYFSAPKLAWLRRNRTTEGVVTTTDTWLLHALTGEFVTDVTTASRSMVLDLDSRGWSDEAVAIFGLDRTDLPEVVGCATPIGTTAAFGPSLPVTGLAVDQQAALVGEGCLAAGQAKCTYGTGAFLLVTTGAMAPVVTSRKAPVPYVHLAWPAARQPSPTSAACWSTARPVTGSDGPNAAVVPIGVAHPTTSGRSVRARPKIATASSDQPRLSRSSTMERDAVVTSVTNSPVRAWSSQVSVVVTTPSVVRLRRNQASFGAEKYGSSGSPEMAPSRSRCGPSWSVTEVARRSCHDRAVVSGRPLGRSHASTVSPWLARPMPCTTTPA